VLVAGGQDGSGLNLAGAEIYDPNANTWTAAGNLASPRSFHNATLLSNGKVLVSGGYATASLTAEIYDPTTNTWSVTGSMSTVRLSASATLLPNGTVLVAGGSPNNQSGLTSAEIYDPAAGTWSATGSMAQPLLGHAATLLPNGAVLVTGAIQYPATTRGPDCELYW